ncbi:hypothetical protein CANMA_001446 [Candida margitis]|uniref:uncharacterized protein n=1 Tax=Candida margitis TaxID=1775924 RepID=UPI0022272697|nr:uncharacterized protein CANMA_001446 [Candida margitis]KAI5969379.1 hypothetical protein CANMA_001446 [Candida margitis]
MNEGTNPNNETGEILESKTLQNDPIVSVNSETSSTINTIDVNTIGGPEIVVSASEEVAKPLNGEDTIGHEDETITSDQFGASVPAEVTPIAKPEETMNEAGVGISNEATINESNEGKIQEIGHVIDAPPKTSQTSTTEDHLEYDDDEEEQEDRQNENVQPQTTHVAGTESGIILEPSTDEKVTDVHREKLPIDFVAENDANNDDTTNKVEQEDANQERNEPTNIEDDLKVDAKTVVHENANNTENGTHNSDRKQENDTEAIEEKIDVVMANGQEEEIELEDKASNQEEDKQYAALKSNPKEHFDEGMDDINTLVEEPANSDDIDAKIPIFLNHNNAKFLLFRTESEDASSPVFEDEKSEDITLEEFFGILRTIPEFDFSLSEEIILSIPQLGGITVTEDNVYCKDLQLSDFLDVYYKLCDCTTQKEKVPTHLDFTLTTQPRFIMKYNSLVDTVKQKGGFDNISNVDYVDNEIEGSRKKRKL